MCWALENFNKCKEKDPVKEKISLYGWTVAVISLLSASGGLMEVLWLFSSSHQTHDERVSSWRSEPSSSLREKAVGNKGRKKKHLPAGANDRSDQVERPALPNVSPFPSSVWFGCRFTHVCLECQVMIGICPNYQSPRFIPMDRPASSMLTIGAVWRKIAPSRLLYWPTVTTYLVQSRSASTVFFSGYYSLGSQLERRQ